jgi:hypothetical protein
MTESPNLVPLKQAFVPALRHISINLFGGVAWVLTYFEDLQHHNQLEQMSISGLIRFTMNGGLTRAAELERWLNLTKSKIFTFQLQIDTDCDDGAEKIREEVFTEYRQVTGDDSLGRHGAINICYPKMSGSYPRMNIDQEFLGNDNIINRIICIPDDLVDDSMTEVSEEYLRILPY